MGQMGSGPHLVVAAPWKVGTQEHLLLLGQEGGREGGPGQRNLDENCYTRPLPPSLVARPYFVFVRRAEEK